MQGRSLWAHMAGENDAFLQICWAMTKCLNPTAVAAGGNYTTGGMREIVQFAARINAPNITEGEKQWLVLFARHFVDAFEGGTLLPEVQIEDVVNLEGPALLTGLVR